MNNSIIIIIDGISTAVGYAPAFKSYGIDCIHIYSSKTFKDKFSHLIKAEDYTFVFEYENDLSFLLTQLKQFHILAVLSGVESGSELKDKLSERLGLQYRNDASTSEARYHKYIMTQTVNEHELLAPEQFTSTNKDELLYWIKNRNVFPIILKPTNSAGVTGVFRCNSLKEAEHYIDTIKDMKSYFGVSNNMIVAQECLQGQEYIVDAVSLDGMHRIINIWEVYREEGSSPLLDGMIIVDHSQDKFQPIINYAKQVFDALGVRNGPSHLELMQTAKGPCIVELNARLHGSLDLKLSTLVNGYDQLHCVVESILCPYHFKHNINQPPIFHGFSVHLLIRSAKQECLTSLDIWEQFAKFKTYVGCKVNYQIGQQVKVTRDLTTALGSVALYSESYDELLTDWKRIRVLEHFTVEHRSNWQHSNISI
ncbi:ATP-grasp domain-containing protein [Providencia hangzhouensis]|uniref:Glutathione synthase/Ribosomal protein S6 modification enzyme (Glutaminyl transferase) n=1 Tax=Providencia rettgeri TaxID=587 RepID=A0A264VUL0_PRORE|nr:MULTISPECIES: ATP-grasp domain-containing protein [Providencia]MBN7844360.1 ATP-grasp domain-containing protein [Providencia rettgeri]MBN7855493.1 ATP-grasp domain-containing protein [Providencia rettgeri]MBN7864141.1 ATP-grasp domain-containing protein [Providencia rettgeri]MBN7870951.1 ATP-grasp domain-containing protein [Providencia rettgeri]MBN7899089.1 ATP-grasp domain-containing protein [Providencia rettgeri]